MDNKWKWAGGLLITGASFLLMGAGRTYSIWDPVSESRLVNLHPDVAKAARKFISLAEKRLGIYLRLTDGFRSYAQQEALYAKGRTASGSRVTNARGGQSYHNFGLAIDLVELRNGQAIYGTSARWEELGALGKSLGFSWGGDWSSFKDYGHFQMEMGKHHSYWDQRMRSQGLPWVKAA